jgi:hypothetical protein
LEHRIASFIACTGVIPLFGAGYVHGVDPGPKWMSRDDGFVLFSDMEFAS